MQPFPVMPFTGGKFMKFQQENFLEQASIMRSINPDIDKLLKPRKKLKHKDTSVYNLIVRIDPKDDHQDEMQHALLQFYTIVLCSFKDSSKDINIKVSAMQSYISDTIFAGVIEIETKHRGHDVATRLFKLCDLFGLKECAWLFMEEFDKHGQSMNTQSIYPCQNGIPRWSLEVMTLPSLRKNELIPNFLDENY